MKVIVVATLLVGLHSTALPGQTPTEFDRNRLSQLLKSDNIMTLREAVRMIDAFPEHSQEFLPKIAARASHPELTEVFRRLLKQNADPKLGETLIRSAATYHPSRQALIEAAVRDAANAAGQGTTQPSDANPKMKATQTRPSFNADASNPTPSKTSPTNPPRAVTKVITQQRKVNRPDKPLPDTAAQLERLNTLLQKPTGQPLEPEDWDFLFQVIDQEITVNRDPRAQPSLYSRVFSLVRSTIEKHYPTNKQGVWDVILDEDTQAPDRLLTVLENLSDKDRESFDFIWQLAGSEDPKLRISALNNLRFDGSTADDYVDELITRMAAKPQSIREYAVTLPRISQKITDESRGKILQWQLEQFEMALAVAPRDQPPHKQTIEIVSQAITVVRYMSPSTQYQWIGNIVQRAEASRYPRVYVRLLAAMKCGIDPAADLLRRLLDEASLTVDRLHLARYLYRAMGHRSDVYPMFREIIVQPNPNPDELLSAILGVIEVRERAAELVPDLVRLLKDPNQSKSHSLTLSAIAAIGPTAAEGAGPTLMSLLADPKQTQLHRQILDTLKNVELKPDVILRLLVKVALNEVPQCDYGAASRGYALAMITNFGRESANFVGRLETLAKSEERFLAGQARRSIDQIQRSLTERP